MKKTYISPEVLIQKVILQQMIATSDPVVQTKDEDADENGEVLTRRRRNDWEDEEFEEEEDW